MVKNAAAASNDNKNSQVAPQVDAKATPQDTKTVTNGKEKQQEKQQGTEVAPVPAPVATPSEAQPIMDLAKDLSSNGLREMRAWIDSVIKERAEGELVAARKQVEELAKGLGMSVQELLGIKPGKSNQMSLKLPSTVPVKYRHPDDAKLTWTGRGRAPQWVKDWLESHGGLDDGIKV